MTVKLKLMQLTQYRLTGAIYVISAYTERILLFVESK